MLQLPELGHVKGTKKEGDPVAATGRLKKALGTHACKASTPGLKLLRYPNEVLNHALFEPSLQERTH